MSENFTSGASPADETPAGTTPRHSAGVGAAQETARGSEHPRHQVTDDRDDAAVAPVDRQSTTTETGRRSSGEVLVNMRQVTKKFGESVVFSDVDLDVDRGEVVVLVGPSGAGKSTLLRCVNGLDRITSGSIEVAGDELSYEEKHLNQIRARVGMVFQQFNLFPHMSVLDNITLAQREVLGRGGDEAVTKAKQMLEQVGMSHKIDAYPGSLSGGQSQRVAIARALAMDPAMMLFDEPTSALDPELVGEVLSVMRELADEGMTMMVVTHEMRFARRVADRIVMIADKGIAEQGDPNQFLDDPQTQRAKDFLASLNED